jgi:hypothetical protein
MRFSRDRQAAAAATGPAAHRLIGYPNRCQDLPLQGGKTAIEPAISGRGRLGKPLLQLHMPSTTRVTIPGLTDLSRAWFFWLAWILPSALLNKKT